MTKDEALKLEVLEIAIAVLDHCYGYGAVSDDMVESTAKVVSAAIAAHGIGCETTLVKGEA